jgi:hypothetical protein
MFSKPTSAALLLLVSASLAAAQQTCNATQKCGSANPCCSEYGFCFPATSEYCLGGCNPLFSNAPSSCKPNAVCQSGTYSFADQSRILTNFTNYDGNVSKWDWTVDQGNIIPGPDGKSTSMTLDTKNNGTRISSTRYVHYGQISAKGTPFVLSRSATSSSCCAVMTGKWPGVVTAFITMSDIRDEIDWVRPLSPFLYSSSSSAGMAWHERHLRPDELLLGGCHSVEDRRYARRRALGHVVQLPHLRGTCSPPSHSCAQPRR